MGKCIAITGAGAGLGRALARSFAGDGHTVLVLGRTRASLDAVAAQVGPACHPIVCDVARPNSVRNAFAAIAEHHTTIDMLINNAAVYQPSFVKDATDDQITTAAMTNFAGPVYCSRAVIPMMKKGGHIINISSETVGMPHAMFSLYQSSKAALERFSEALHAELEPDGIRVTMVRAGQMNDADSRSPVTGELARLFAEENLKRGLNLRERPISNFKSVAEFIRLLSHLPSDLNVPEIVLEARRP
jgi:meso-butanediol dehydrogenase/(S,S)-butanediol dehydrogenase/diacetyl reductase